MLLFLQTDAKITKKNLAFQGNSTKMQVNFAHKKDWNPKPTKFLQQFAEF